MSPGCSKQGGEADSPAMCLSRFAVALQDGTGSVSLAPWIWKEIGRGGGHLATFILTHFFLSRLQEVASPPHFPPTCISWQKPGYLCMLP